MDILQSIREIPVNKLRVEMAMHRLNISNVILKCDATRLSPNILKEERQVALLISIYSGP